MNKITSICHFLRGKGILENIDYHVKIGQETCQYIGFYFLTYLSVWNRHPANPKVSFKGKDIFENNCFFFLGSKVRWRLQLKQSAVFITRYTYILNGWSETPWAKTVGDWKERIKETKCICAKIPLTGKLIKSVYILSMQRIS